MHCFVVWFYVQDFLKLSAFHGFLCLAEKHLEKMDFWGWVRSTPVLPGKLAYGFVFDNLAFLRAPSVFVTLAEADFLWGRCVSGSEEVSGWLSTF